MTEPEHDLVETFLGGAYVMVDRYDPENYIERYDGATGATIAMRERAARRYVEQLKAEAKQRALQGPTWGKFLNYARQASGHREGVEFGVKLLMHWASEKPEVRAALDLFTREALLEHLSVCAGCGEPIVARPGPNPRQFHSDACRKRASRK